MRTLLDIVRDRRSARGPYDPGRAVPQPALADILEAARWAPTAHNMQNFGIIVVEDPALLARIGTIRSTPSLTFLRENYRQLAFSEEELRRRGTGLLASQFPPSWRRPDVTPEEALDPARATLAAVLGHCPTLLVVVCDERQRAPASEGDVLGMMSLGCVLQNMWLTAEAHGLGLHVLSTLASATVEPELRALLALPPGIRIAFGCRLGYPAPGTQDGPRVRRELARIVHHDRY